MSKMNTAQLERLINIILKSIVAIIKESDSKDEMIKKVEALLKK